MSLKLKNVRLLDQQKLQASLQELASSADALNSLSDQLTKQILDVEAVLNRSGIGLTASVTTETWSDERGDQYDIWRLCYEKYAGKWGFTIEHLSGVEGFDDSQSCETWPFKEAPREHRLKAVDKIPELIDALVQKTKEFASDVSAATSYAEALAATFSKADATGKK
jgi:hypothetical protein